MKIILLKSIIGILAFMIGGIITVLLIIPILNSFILNDIMLNTIQIFFNIGIAIIIYRLAVKSLLKKEIEKPNLTKNQNGIK